MTSPLVLTIAAALLDLLFKSSLCFAAALVLARLIQSPARRFALWLTYLLGTFAYAAALALLILRELLAPATPALAAFSNTAVATATPTLWTLPAAAAPYAAALLALAAIAYLVTVSASLALHLRRQAHLRRALLYAYDPPAHLATLAQSLADELHLPYATVQVLPGLASPATIGWRHPMVLLPTSCTDRNESLAADLQHHQTADILRHELHHIRRRDWLLERIASSVRALLFFQPTLSLALNHLRLERELACDQAVLRSLEAPPLKQTALQVVPRHPLSAPTSQNHHTDNSSIPTAQIAPAARLHYAESLLHVARLARRAALGLPTDSQPLSLELAASVQLAVGIEFAATPSHLETRLRAILAQPCVYPRGLRALIALSTIAVSCAVIAGLPYLTVTLAFTAPGPGAVKPRSAWSPAKSDTQLYPQSNREFDTGVLGETHPAKRATLSTRFTHIQPAATRPAALTAAALPHNLAAVQPFPIRPATSISPTADDDASRNSASQRQRFRLEPAADTEDPPPTPTNAASLDPAHRDGPLSTSTNPALQVGAATHTVVTVLADAAILLSRHGSEHDDH